MALRLTGAYTRAHRTGFQVNVFTFTITRQPCRFVANLLCVGMENRSPVSLVESRSSSATMYCQNVDDAFRERLNTAASIIQLQCRSIL